MTYALSAAFFVVAAILTERHALWLPAVVLIVAASADVFGR